MKYKYDFHIHSGLSPCADKDMTPVDIVAYLANDGFRMCAIADHNAIDNVQVAMRAGEAFGVTVVPAFELQTSEDIHVLCLFPDFDSLKAFFDTLSFQDIKNRPDIFGEQLIFDEDDNITGSVDRMLLASSTMSVSEVYTAVRAYRGVAVPAHIDREANGMLAILGAVTEEFTAVELSNNASAELRTEYQQTHRVLVDTDSHTIAQMVNTAQIDLPQCTATALIDYLLR